jgi:hypothetical protein
VGLAALVLLLGAGGGWMALSGLRAPSGPQAPPQQPGMGEAVAQPPASAAELAEAPSDPQAPPQQPGSGEAVAQPPAPAAEPAPQPPELGSDSTVRAPPTERKPRPAREGTLRLVLKGGGWGDVYVGKKYLGRLPKKKQFSLPAGQHTLKLTNNPRFKEYRSKVVIRAGKVTEHTITLVPRRPAR